MTQKPLALAGILGAITVAMGAFGAHFLKELMDPGYLDNYQTGILYQFIHVLAIFGAAILLHAYPHKYLKMAIWAWLIGILFFSGSLYAMGFASMAGQHFPLLGPITPIGGVSFMVGWILLALAAAKK